MQYDLVRLELFLTLFTHPVKDTVPRQLIKIFLFFLRTKATLSCELFTILHFTNLPLNSALPSIFVVKLGIYPVQTFFVKHFSRLPKDTVLRIDRNIA